MPLNLPVLYGRTSPDWHVFRLRTPKPKRAINPNIFKIVIYYPTREDVEEWCMTNLKGPWSENRSKSGENIQVFKIRDAQDAMLFKLTWNNEKPRFE